MRGSDDDKLAILSGKVGLYRNGMALFRPLVRLASQFDIVYLESLKRQKCSKRWQDDKPK
eukprot:3648893-Ditylum_brightwellii.AAC.1